MTVRQALQVCTDATGTVCFWTGVPFELDADFRIHTVVGVDVVYLTMRTVREVGRKIHWRFMGNGSTTRRVSFISQHVLSIGAQTFVHRRIYIISG